MPARSPGDRKATSASDCPRLPTIEVGASARTAPWHMAGARKLGRTQEMVARRLGARRLGCTQVGVSPKQGPALSLNRCQPVSTILPCTSRHVYLPMPLAPPPHHSSTPLHTPDKQPC